MKKTSAARAFISIQILLFMSSLMTAQNPDLATAGVYFNNAEALYFAGDVSSASEMISKALQFDPDSSEALYLGAMISFKRQESTLEGIQRAEKAAAKATWTKTDPDSAALTLAEALVRIGRLEQALPMLQRLALTKSEDPRSALFLARAYRKSGRLELAEKTASAARRMFPRNEELYLISSELAALAGKKAEARAIVATGLSEIPEGKRLMLKSIELEPDPDKRILAVDAFAAKGGRDPLAAVIAMEARQKGREKYYELFISLEGMSRADLWRRVLRLVTGSAALSESFKKQLSGFTGERDLDADSNGFYEERWIYGSGFPVSWEKDANEDGKPELRTDFFDGRIFELAFDRGGIRTVLHYEEYPFLDTARETDGDGMRRYFLTPRTLRCAMTDLSMLTMDFRLPTRSQIISAAYREEEIQSGTTAVRAVNLSSGRNLYKEEDGDGDGGIDRKTWYAEGKPIAGKRDLDGDGSFDLTEVYAAGALRERRVDADGDGIDEYAELVGEIPSKLWDYNADGRWDSRETSGAGTLVREFSTAFNGVFNLRVEFRAGRISSVKKNGGSVPVSLDDKTGVVWIGTRQNAGIRDSAKEGTITLGGRRYLIFRHNSTTYIEELE